MTSRRRKTLLFIMVALAALLPPAAFLAISWFQTVHEMDGQLNRYASTVVDRSDEIFGSAESTLAALSKQLEPHCGDATVQALRRTVYESLYFQEATLSANGSVLCSSQRVYDTPQPIDYAENRVVPERGIHISPPVALARENTVSIIIHYRAGDTAMLGLQLNPVLLGDPVRKYAAEDEVTLLVQRNDGAILSQFGFSPTMPADELKGNRVLRQSSRYPIRVVAVGSPTWLLHSWRQNALIFSSLGLLTSALLFVLLLYLARHQFSPGASLHDALVDGQFHVYYQPVLDTESGLCVGAEALLRWQHPQLGLVMPGMFIPAAEESGFIVELTKWLMGRVVTDVAALLKENPRFYVSLNVSPQHFDDPKLLADVKAIFGERVAPNQIVFEVTENQLMNEDKAQEMMKNVRAMGTLLAIDDFGSGYSSLKYLSSFPFDYLKIDKTFVDAIGTESVTAGLVDTIVQMAGQLKLKTVAEGVESPVQLTHLRRLKVNCVQGWLFSKALPTDQFLAYVAANKTYVLGPGAAQRAKYG
ncbi:MAG: EAL domain-containing protein [Nevskia sp.]|nr:EAL domain-containing protein [Nevskia sp.]